MPISDDSLITTAECKWAAQLVVRRGGAVHYRVVRPDWIDPADTSYSRQRGGRWNPVLEFGALYLNSSIQVAASNARAQHAGRAIKLFDLLPEAQPELVSFEIPIVDVLDACTPEGVAVLGFSENFPYAVPWQPCQAVAREAHRSGLPGIAARSSAEVTETTFAGEELALFEDFVVGTPLARRKFWEWYPDPIPGKE